MRLGLFLLLLLSVLLALSFKSTVIPSYPQDYFRSPVLQQMYLSGTFGELRPNHFHSGIDIKGKVGQTLVSVADGYVARIKIGANGYGKVLYIRHPNGYTSVYAHMHKFAPAIEAYVKQQQYDRENFEIELFPSANQFVFKKGEKIGEMGLTGRSFGPHLHFEIRATATEKPINPLLFGLYVADKRPPRMHQIKLYHLNDKRETVGEKIVDLIPKGAGYGVRGDTIMIPAWRTGFALKVYDHMDGVSNWNGIYQLSMFENDIPMYDFKMESFSFSETRYLNAHLDYPEQKNNKAYFNRCYALPGNELSIYEKASANGVIELSSRRATKITMLASDANDNQTTLTFWVKRAEVRAPESPIYNYFLPYAEENLIENQSLRVYMPKGTLYENLYLQYQSSPDPSHNVYSSVHHLHHSDVPVHKYYELSIRPSSLPAEWRDKAYIARCDKDNEVINCGGKWDGDKLKTRVRSLGDFSIMVDDVPPTITPIDFSTNMKGYNKMSFKIKDDLDTAGKARGLRYEGRIDGKWVLFEYDGKKDLLTHRFNKNLSSGKHQLRLVVTDDRNNSRILERSFVR